VIESPKKKKKSLSWGRGNFVSLQTQSANPLNPTVYIYVSTTPIFEKEKKQRKTK